MERLHLKRCVQCASEFYPEHKYHILCSEVCRGAQSLARRRDRTRHKLSIPRQCLQCGKEFTRRRVQQKYCTPRCRDRFGEAARRATGQIAANERAKRNAVEGRVCTWCGRLDSEVSFAGSFLCVNCAKKLTRNGRCPTCRGPRSKPLLDLLTLGCWPGTFRARIAICERCDYDSR